MPCLITGGSGQLGSDLIKEMSRRQVPFLAPDLYEMPIEDENIVAAYFEREKPSLVYHCAAYTAVDRAESEAADCWAVNAIGTANIARACRAVGAKLVYISTDYVFSGMGEDFYPTDAPKAPPNVYAASKFAGEMAVRAALDDYFIVRISWVFGKNGNNFIKTMLRLAKDRDQLNVVADQIGSPTYTADLAPRLIDLAATSRYGEYHMTNEGVCSWAEFAQEIFRQTGLAVRVNPIKTSEYPTAARRPLNSRLDKSCLDAAGIGRLPPWQDAVRRFLIELEDAD